MAVSKRSAAAKKAAVTRAVTRAAKSKKFAAAAKIGAKTVTKTAAKKTAAKGVASVGKEQGFMKLLGTKGLGGAMKAHPFTSAIGIFFLIQMILNQIKKHGQKLAIDQPLQRQQLEAQMSASPEDVYYQAALPSLMQERQGAQNALLQAILAGGGQMPSVPGERMIGGE